MTDQTDFLSIAPRDCEHFIGLRIGAGWSPYLLTFMFNRMPGNRLAIMRQQARSVERAYAALLTRMVRQPRRAAAHGHLPILLGAPDLPVPKREKTSPRDAVINDGQHVQGILLTPRCNRMKTDACTFIESNQDLFTNITGLRRLHAQPVLYGAEEVWRYCRKSVERGWFDDDATIILPKSLSELTRR